MKEPIQAQTENTGDNTQQEEKPTLKRSHASRHEKNDGSLLRSLWLNMISLIWSHGEADVNKMEIDVAVVMLYIEEIKEFSTL